MYSVSLHILAGIYAYLHVYSGYASFKYWHTKMGWTVEKVDRPVIILTAILGPISFLMGFVLEALYGPDMRKINQKH